MQVKDYAGVRTQPKILALFEQSGKIYVSNVIESLLYSEKIKKINMFGWNQERILAITTEHIYNIKKQKPKRKIGITLLGGISKTVNVANKQEFTIHVPT